MCRSFSIIQHIYLSTYVYALGPTIECTMRTMFVRTYGYSLGFVLDMYVERLSPFKDL